MLTSLRPWHDTDDAGVPWAEVDVEAARANLPASWPKHADPRLAGVKARD